MFICNLWDLCCVAKMWGPGAEQGGILQTSSCRLDLKEPYYRMSQPQAYSTTQDQQPNQLLQSQVPFIFKKSGSLIQVICSDTDLVDWRNRIYNFNHWMKTDQILSNNQQTIRLSKFIETSWRNAFEMLTNGQHDPWWCTIIQGTTWCQAGCSKSAFYSCVSFWCL